MCVFFFLCVFSSFSHEHLQCHYIFSMRLRLSQSFSQCLLCDRAYLRENNYLSSSSYSHYLGLNEIDIFFLWLIFFELVIIETSTVDDFSFVSFFSFSHSFQLTCLIVWMNFYFFLLFYQSENYLQLVSCREKNVELAFFSYSHSFFK